MTHPARWLLALPLALAWPRGPDTPARAPDFVCDVLPLLQRQGCASAYCHGAATGQGGFKLSLFGSAPEADHAAITRALGGRRLDLLDPEQSLLLQKPLRRVVHGGGRRLYEGSREHVLLRAWITAGAPFALAADERLHQLTAHRAGDELCVEAHFVDPRGARTADVSRLAEFSTSDDRVAAIDGDGHIVDGGPGEAYLFARYGGRNARVAVLRPFGPPLGDVADADPSPLDAAFVVRMRALGLTAAPPASPLRLLRRLHLDLTGMPPSNQAMRRFLALPAATRVQATVDELLATPAFAEMLGRRLATWLELPGEDEAAPARRQQVRALRAQVLAFAAGDRAWPELTRTLLADGSPYLGQHEDPRDRAELVARALLGVRVGCARCHDHPHDRWRRRDHLAFAACFTDRRQARQQTMATGDREPPGQQRGEQPPARLFDPDTGEPVTPQLLPLADDPQPASLVAFVHDRRHDYAARALCNRVFAWLLGRGLVEPLDDHRDTNPAVHEAWLAALQATFHAGGDRLRPLIAAVVTARVYQLDSAADETELDPRTRFFAWRASKPLDADVLRRAITAALGVEESALPALPASPLRRHLELLNGEAMTRALHAPGNTIEALSTLGGEAGEQLDALFSTCLTRLPTADERAALLPDFDAHACAFALLASREFEFLR